MTGSVLIIGAGPAGLAVARALAAGGVDDVLVIDREQQAGGVPRHCHHNGFGIRDLHRSLSGPRYAAELLRRTVAAGVRIETETMATGWVEPGVLSLTSPAGVRTMTADAIVLATGARERPRPARLIAGDRPEGVFTTGQLQQWAQKPGLTVGRRAVVVGAEHVSYSAVMTLRSAGVRTVAMVTDLPRHQTYPAFAAATRWGLRVPLLTSTEVAAIGGRGRVRDVELHNPVTDSRRTIAVDTVVFTGDWIPDHELARSAGISMDPRSKGPVVDESGQSSAVGIYAAGNLVHPAETADITALRGAAVGASLARRLTGREHSSPGAAVDIVVAAPLLWSSPTRIAAPTASDRAKVPAGLILRTTEFRRRPTVVITQGDRPLARFRVREAIPYRSLRVPIDWSALVRPDAGTVHIHLE
jgi:thioredoxin reductase